MDLPFTTPLPIITGFYAGILALIFGYLGFRVGPLRSRLGISMLDGGDKQLALEMRRHGNFAEHVPLALLLMAIIEVNGAAPGALHGMGVVLVAARIVHPIGLEWDKVTNPLRGIGAGGTGLVTAVAGVWAIVQFVRA